jgi:hypothetical protein
MIGTMDEHFVRGLIPQQDRACPVVLAAFRL